MVRNTPARRPQPLKLSALALAALGGGALAQQPAPDIDAATLPEVAVTAKGYAAATVETPASIDVITADDIARKGAHSLGQAFVGEPGLAATSDGAQSMNPVGRGLKKESLVLMVDGMRLNHAIPGFTGAGAMPAQRKL